MGGVRNVPIVEVDALERRFRGTPYSVSKTTRSRIWIMYDADSGPVFGIFPSYPNFRGESPWVVLDYLRIVRGEEPRTNDDVTEDTRWRQAFGEMIKMFSLN